MAYWRLFYHFVWTTKNREPLLTPDIEPSVLAHDVAGGLDGG